MAFKLSLKQIIVLELVTIFLQSSGQRKPLHIGGFFPLSPNKASVPGQALLAAADLAFNHVNKSDILQEYELRMIVKDSKVYLSFSSSYFYTIFISLISFVITLIIKLLKLGYTINAS